jgi:prepilin-type N-terminal cleavage/methylation domain-containing protein
MAEKMRTINDNGYTLVELLVAMGITGLVMTSIYSAFYSQQKSYAVQEQVAGMQQNLRAGIYHVERDIRMVGYDPTFSGGFGLKASEDNDRATNSGSIYFTVDADEDGVVDNTEDEQIAFRLDGGDLQKYSPGSTPPWIPVAENIESLGFIYNDRDGDPTATLSDVRSIEITLQAKTSSSDPGYIQWRTLVTEVKCRNLGL